MNKDLLQCQTHVIISRWHEVTVTLSSRFGSSSRCSLSFNTESRLWDVTCGITAVEQCMRTETPLKTGGHKTAWKHATAAGFKQRYYFFLVFKKVTVVFLEALFFHSHRTTFKLKNKSVVPPPKHISLSRVSSLDVSSTNSSKQGSADGWKVLRDSVAFWILRNKQGSKTWQNTLMEYYRDWLII